MEVKVESTYTTELMADLRARGLWLDGSLAEHIDHWAVAKPDAVFLIDRDVELTWRQVRDRAYRLAQRFLKLGIAKGDCIVVQLPNWHEMVIAYVAMTRIGAVIVPAMPIYRGNELRHMISLTGASAIIVPVEFRGFDYLSMARQLFSEQPTLEHMFVVRTGDASLSEDELSFAGLEAGEHVPGPAELGPPPGADDGHIIGFTSGTESHSKGCFHTWNTYSHSPRTQARIYHFGPDDCELVPSPITHTAGLAGGILKVILMGGRACLMDVWSPSEALRLIDEHGCTQATGATAFIAGLVESFRPEEYSATSLRRFISGGAPVPEELVRRCGVVFPKCQLLPCFGQTEGLLVTSCVPEDPVEKITATDGRSIPGVDVEIRAEDESVMPTGEVGQIVYRGPSMMLGYWANLEVTASITTPDGWRRTGDLGFRDGDGYVRVTGRLKEMIIRGGMNISTREIEELLQQHSAVSRVAVIGLPDEILGERSCAVVVPAGEPPTLQELVDYLLDEHQLAKPKLPEKLVIVDELPMTLTGKVQKVALRDTILSADQPI